jgi:hypothetical protein
MSSPLNEFDVLKLNLPLQDNLSNYLQVRTIVNYEDDLEFRLATGLDKIVSKFGHSGWTEMKPLLVGIKCYTENNSASVFVRHGASSTHTYVNTRLLESFDVENEKWYTFKYPLLANYHTETRILLSNEVRSYTLAILNVSERIRYDLNVNYFPPGYASFDTNIYGSFNKALVYIDENGNHINSSETDLKDIVLVPSIAALTPA